MKSPTVVEGGAINSYVLKTLTIQVPSYLVTAYKLNDYWYDAAAIEGFDTEEVSEWTLNADLVLGAHDRMFGTPTVNIASNASLKINGEDGMPLNNLNLLNSWDFLLRIQTVCTSAKCSLFLFESRIYYILHRHRCAFADAQTFRLLVTESHELSRLI